MSEKHTPGPWILDYDNGSTQDILSLKHGGICTVRRAGRHDNATFAANARLIAAAPELLEALEHALDVMEIHGVGIGCKTQDAARAAIAKAKGEAS